MNLFVISYKVGWQKESGYVTYAGFPLQMSALSTLFDQTLITLLIRSTPEPGGCIEIKGNHTDIHPLPEPQGTDLRRKVSMLFWLPQYIPNIWKAIRAADVVHAPVPGDVGGIGLLIALLQRKRLFIRHCGTWGEPVTLSDRLMLWLLETIADDKNNIVFATGGADVPPSQKNPHIQWIFSTTLTQKEISELPLAPQWSVNTPLRLVTVGRVTAGKNMESIIRALPAIQKVHPNTTLDILGAGNMLETLKKLAASLGVQAPINFHGNVSHTQVMETLGRSHLFVFPTQTKEGFPKAVLEALACGVPVIAPRVSVIPQLLANGSGCLLEETTPNAIARAVLDMTSNPPQLAGRRTAARQSAQGYTLEAWAGVIDQRLQSAWGKLREDA